MSLNTSSTDLLFGVDYAPSEVIEEKRNKNLVLPSFGVLRMGKPGPTASIQKVNQHQNRIFNLSVNFEDFDAMLNAVKIVNTATQNNAIPRTIEPLIEDEGLFIDFVLGQTYLAFEIHADGDIVMIKETNGVHSPAVLLEKGEITDQLFQ